MDPYDSPDQFEYQWAIVLYKWSCENDKKPEKGAYFAMRDHFRSGGISQEPINVEKKWNQIRDRLVNTVILSYHMTILNDF